ncbi:MAG: hypothetical protein SXG53_10135 [Pseudomonadota bacterium]|nr:hypothetical protein [Pseudomonadota bacterium]
MNTLIKPVSQVIGGAAAANADRLADGMALTVPEVGIDTVVQSNIESTGGWDAYEVWRRLIKDARDRRRLQDSI